MNEKIKFGTDGWRAIIAQEYTVDNVKRVAAGTAKWMISQNYRSVVIGHDCRFAGRLFLEVTTQVMNHFGIHVYYADDFVSTPMVSLGIVKLKADLGIVITASHNPPSYNGFKLKSKFGGPSIPSDIAAVELLIPDVFDEPLASFEEIVIKQNAEQIDLESMYVNHAIENFDIDLINKSGIVVAYDAMFGAGQRAVKRLLPNVIDLNCEYNPSFNNTAPEPIAKNLQDLAALIQTNDTIDIGIANDGDADRIGLFDNRGVFVDSHHILLLLLLYQFKYKQQSGEVIITFSVTDRMKELADKYGLNSEVTKIGFKYIAEIMTTRDVLVGGEESGGLAVKGHIPERDGIWIGLMILEFMAKSGKSLVSLIQEVYDEVGSFWVERDDLHISEKQKLQIIQNCLEDKYSNFGNFIISGKESTDGYKFRLGEGRWVLIRPSGTEPVLRVYAQGNDIEDSISILSAVRSTIL